MCAPSLSHQRTWFRDKNGYKSAQRKSMLELYQSSLEKFPGGLVVRILGFHCCNLGSVPGWGSEIPQAMQCGKNKIK